jgi:hypothetical protein
LNADAIAYTTQDGEEASWHWSPHQFRRFFAIMYFYRFEGGLDQAGLFDPSDRHE